MSGVPGWFYGIITTCIYFGYIFLGGFVFMMLERPREVKICEDMQYQIKRVQATQRMAEEQLKNALADAAQAEAIDTKIKIEKRSVHGDYEDYTDGIEYILIKDPKTYFEARDYCESNGMILSRITQDNILNKETDFTTQPIWLDLIKPEPICKNTKCYSWHSRYYLACYGSLVY